MAKTKIEWCDETWNPTVGCKKVSAGCAGCYAEKMAKRLAAMGQVKYQKVVTEISANGRWTGHVLCLPDRLDIPLRWRKPRRVFVDSMSDLFHEDVPFDFILRVWLTMAKTSHTHIILTKRPERMHRFVTEWLPGAWGLATMSMRLLETPIQNIQLGVSVEDQKSADERIPWLLRTKAAKRIVSVEPMLGEVDLHKAVGHNSKVLPSKFSWFRDSELHWVICGCESGPNRRPMNIDWARSLRDQCQAAGVPFFLKQMEANGKIVKMPELDGQVWDEIPCVPG